MTKTGIAGPVRKAYVDAPTGQIHLRRAGRGDPLVLLHQSPSSSSMWEPVLPELAERGFDAIAFDLPGTGMSDPPPSSPGLAGYASAIAGAIGRLGLERVDILSHHTGASVALELAVRHPEVVRRVVAYGIPLLDDGLARQLREERPPSLTRDGAAVLDWWTQVWDAAGTVAEVAVPRTIAELLLAGGWSAWPHNAVGAGDHAELMRALRVPLLALAGTREMLRAQTEEAVALSPWARFEAMGDVGGYVVDEAPTALADATAAFLRLPDHDVVPSEAAATP